MSDKTLRASFTSNNSADGVISSVTVPDGEIWYVDTVLISAAGGTGADVDVGARITDPDDLGGDDPRQHKHTTSHNSPTNYQGTLGAYAYPGDTVEIVEWKDMDSANVSHHVTVHARRVV